MGIWEINLGQLVKKLIIILSLRVDTSKNRNINHLGKKTCVYKSNYISLPCDSMMSSALNFCFLSTLLQPPLPKKKKIILDEK